MVSFDPLRFQYLRIHVGHKTASSYQGHAAIDNDTTESPTSDALETPKGKKKQVLGKLGEG